MAEQPGVPPAQPATAAAAAAVAVAAPAAPRYPPAAPPLQTPTSQGPAAGPSQPAAPADPKGPAPAAFRPLNVKDALSYLDRVKVTFNDQAEVYDRFLMIMKEFKSQGIDTPGVIERVSTLFRGHPALIQGFNTFLPPGYRIECSVSTSTPQDEGGVTTITVTTPMGMTTRTQITAPGAAGSKAAGTSLPTQAKPLPIPAEKEAAKPTTATRPAPPASKPAQTPLSSKPDAKAALHLPTLPPIPSISALAASTPVATPGAISLLSSQFVPGRGADMAAAMAAASAASISGVSPANDHFSRPPMEFNHAINYVNKIKNRFVRDPDTYKAFLEILQTYQKEGRAIQDVYAQVTTLFHAAPDLLDEFKQFLPDTSGDQANVTPFALGQMAGGSGSQARTGGTKRPSTSNLKRDEVSGVKKAKPSKGKAVEDKSKSKRPTKTDSKDARKGPSPSDGAYSEAGAEPSLYSQHQHVNPFPPGYPVQAYPTHQPQHPAYAYEAPPLPPPPQPILPLKPQASQVDLAFFSRVKIYTSDVSTYHEFLKLLNLYTQDILDLTALVSRAFLFIGQDAGLWRDFREMVGWTEGRALGDPGGRIEIVDGLRVVENVPSLDGPRRGKGDSGKGWKTYGPSYRQLPPSEISLNCSGRDALCWDVLNDEWISQPSWASDEGFVAHRKNPYEEALHRSEEERHEYDYHIEANLRTIALLEPIATRIAIMEADERATFRLKPGLGNQSKSIYQRVIKKVYGKEQGGEVIQALHENPCVAVPIVLARLKQKDDEWKRALREWNRVWRDVDAKNFWKSLDHQAISLKASDKRTHTSKALVTEIETMKREQRQRAIAAGLPPSSPHSQLQYDFSDRDALSDAFKLVFCFLDRTPTISAADKDKLDAFLRRFLPSVFALSTTDFALSLLPVAGADDDVDSLDGGSDGGTSVMDDVSEGTSVVGVKRGGKKSGGDLRKKALKNAVGPGNRGARGDNGRRSKVSSPAPSSRAASPALSAADTTDGDMTMADVPLPIDPLPTDLSSLASLLAPAVEATGESLATSETLATSEMLVEAAPAGESSTSDSSVVGMVVDELASPSIDALEVFESSAGTLEHATIMESLPEVIVPVDDRPPRVDIRRQWNLFANSNMYCLLRLLQIVYLRLTILKKSAVTLASPPPPQPITARHVPSLSLSSTIGSNSLVPPAHYYQRALGLCERLFDGAIDQAAFEEGMRYMFGTQGYVLFTFDKLLHGIVKQSQIALSDSKSQDLFDLLQEDRAHPDRSTSQQQTFYRSQAESAIGNDENLYRIEWVPDRSSLAIQLLGKDSVSTDDLPTAEREWAAYIEKFVLSDPTPGTDPKTIPFLWRNMRKASPAGTDAFPSNIIVKSSLQCKICLRSYRIFYGPGTEDFISRRVTPTPLKKAPSSSSAAVFEKWLEARRAKLEEAPKEQEEEEVKMDVRA